MTSAKRAILSRRRFLAWLTGSSAVTLTACTTTPTLTPAATSPVAATATVSAPTVQPTPTPLASAPASGYSIFQDTMADLTWPEIEQAAKDNTPVLFPIAVIEEHGPHLPLGTDTYLTYQFAQLAKQELEGRGHSILVMPPYYWGINVSTGSFPGSFTMQPETLRAVLHDIFQCLSNWKFKRVFTLNLHGDYIHGRTLLEAVQAARNDLDLDVRNILDRYSLRRLGLTETGPYLVIQDVPPIDYADTHAGGSETGQFAAFYPHLANLDLAQQLPPQNDGFTPRGYWGEPSRYDVEASRRFIATYVRLTADAIAGALKG